ncbi:MAG: hypothetical protein C0402_14255 [Thermodesulfovibrio sp.]|nr:hypothetical protein [Thermodesulfovibrio sp.]
MDRTCYKLSDYRFSISTDAVSFREFLAQLYPTLRCAPGPCSSEWVIRQETSPDDNFLFSYTLYDHEQAVYSSPDRSGLLEYLEWTILRQLLCHHDHLLQLHAAGAARDGQGLLLCGPPGSGKSTLALALLLDGWQCLSDEITLLEPGCRRVWPFPRSFHLTEQTMSLFPCLTQIADGGGFVDKSGKRRFDPSGIRLDWVSSPASPAWLVFPEYRPEGPEGLIPLGETESLSLLIDQTINLASHGSGGLDMLLRLIGRCSCCRLLMRDLRSGRDLLNTLTQKSAGKTAVLCHKGLSRSSAGEKQLCADV